MSKELEKQIKDLQEAKDKLEKDLEESNSLVVSEQEEKQKLDKQITELSDKVKELEVYKENFEKAEKEKTQKELSDKYGKLFDEETFKSDEVQKAIETCDTSALNSKFVEVMAAKALEKAEKDSQEKEQTVEISATQNKDLLEPTVLQKYGLQ